MPEIEAHRQEMQEEAISDIRETAIVRVVTREEAEADLMSVQDFVTHQDFARHEMFDRERDQKLSRLEAEVADNKEHYKELCSDTKESNLIVRRIEAKLNNGISDKLKRLDETVVGAVGVRAIIAESAAVSKKRGREWLTVLCAICVVALTVLGFVL